jgi:phospholipid-translocating ATPase
MYTIMFRLCRQPAYWITMVVSLVTYFCLVYVRQYAFTMTLRNHFFLFLYLQLISGVGMGPELALKYFRYTYRSSAINILQKAERSRGPVYTLVNLESQQLKSDKDTMMVPMATTPVKGKSSVYEPLLSDSPMASRRSLASSSSDLFQPAHSRTSYPRNIKAN